MERSADAEVAKLYERFMKTIHRPAYLKGESQFTPAEVTTSRVVSSLRTAVESSIGHLKMMDALARLWKGDDPEGLHHTLLIAAALVNRNFKRVRSDRVPDALPARPIQSESLLIQSTGQIGPAETIPAELSYDSGMVGRYLITAKNRRNGEAKRIWEGLSDEDKAKYTQLSKLTTKDLKADLTKRGVTFPSNSVKSELVLRSMGKPCRLDHAERLHWTDLDHTNCKALPDLTYDALRWGFAVPSSAKEGELHNLHRYTHPLHWRHINTILFMLYTNIV